MRCFIAMAFGRKDTELMYNEGIRPALLDRGIEPIRVDQVEHNDNINDRIISEIQTADFAIADLTYARPSVYYEAGFAERTIPVIYTMRRDHFGPMPGDQFGNFKVHFDLSMKNLIDWIPGDDNTFVTRLGTRIDKMIEPLKADLAKKKQQREKAIAFSNLPVKERKEIILKLAAKIISDHGFESAGNLKKRLGYSTCNPDYRGENSFFSSDGKTYTFVNIAVETDIERTPHTSIKDRPEYNLNVHYNLNQVEAIKEYWLIVCFHAVSFQAVCHTMSEFKPDVEHQTLLHKKDFNVPRLPAGFTGEVYRDFQFFGNPIRKMWDGGDRVEGYLTRDHPSGTESVVASIYKEFRFVYAGFSFRAVPRTITTHIMDNISSEDNFSEKLIQFLSRQK